MAVSELYLGDDAQLNVSRIYFGDPPPIFERSNTLSNGHFANYRLDATSGSVIDSKGGYHGTNVGATRGVTGQIGNAFSFTVNDYVNIDALRTALAATTVGSFSCRVKPVDATPSASELILSFNYSAGVQRFNFSINATTGILACIGVNDAGVTQWRVATDGQAFSDNTWSTFAFTFDAATPKIYIDGVFVPQTVTISTDLTYWLSQATLLNNGRIGNRSFGGERDFFNGTIDDLNWWTRALTAAEALEDHQRTAHIPITLNDGLIANYRLDETTGAVINSRGSYHGTNNGATRGVTGQIGNAFSFTVNDYVNIDAALTPLAATTQGTWSCWIKPFDVTVSDTQPIIQFGDTSANEFLLLMVTDSSVRFLARSGANQWRIDTDGAILQQGVFTHICITQDGVSPVMYVNGEAVPQTFIVTTNKTAWFSQLSGIDNSRVGCRNDNNSGNYAFFEGTIDDVNFWNRALTAAEALEDSQRTAPIPRTLNDIIIANWKLDETTGAVIDSVNAYNGTNNGATRGVTGKLANAFSFDGVNDYVSIADNNAFSFKGAGNFDLPFSVDAWIYRTANQAGGILGKSTNSTGGNNEWSFYISGVDQLVFQTSDGVFSIRCRQDSVATIPLNQWVHVAARYSGAGNDAAIQLFIDGVLTPSVGLGQDGSYVNMDNTTTTVEIGSLIRLHASPSWFKGSLDNINLFNAYLTDAEILYLYNSGAGRTTPF